MSASDTPNLEVLFVSELPLFPLDQGFKVHGYHMACALKKRNLRVAMSSLRPTDAPDLPASLVQMLLPWPEATEDDLAQLHRSWRGPLSRFRYKLAARQALDINELAGVYALVREYQPRVVVALGSHGPALLRTIYHPQERAKEKRHLKSSAHAKLPATLWYAADDLAWFHLTRLSRLKFARWPGALHAAAFWAGFERSFANHLDAAIGVTDVDARLLRRIAGVQRGVTIRNGVDLDYFQPDPAIAPSGRTLIFWGRLDFEPNIDAVRWFAVNILPKLRSHMPDATFQMIGKNPAPVVQKLASLPGVELVGPVEDIRPFAHRASVVVLPMRIGGGIKNKLLEAAALGKAIVATPRTVRDLPGHSATVPATVCRSPRQWVDALIHLLNEPSAIAASGSQARQWAQTHHTWDAAADRFISLLDAVAAVPDATATDHRRQAQFPSAV